MPLFGSKPTKKETRAFGRGKQVSAAAAEKYARDKARRQAFAAKKRAAAKKGR
jgi:hypothetical protein